MYSLKDEYLEFFKEIRTSVYANLIGCSQTLASCILNGNKMCSENLAKAFISVRFDISFKHPDMLNYLKKYFAKEK